MDDGQGVRNEEDRPAEHVWDITQATHAKPDSGHSGSAVDVRPSSFYDDFGEPAYRQWFGDESDSASTRLSNLAVEYVHTSGNEGQFWNATGSSTCLAAPAADPQQPPLALLAQGLTHLAEEVSNLVELFSKTDPGENESLENDYRQMIEGAFDSISAVRRDYRITDARRRYAVEILETGFEAVRSV